MKKYILILISILLMTNSAYSLAISTSKKKYYEMEILSDLKSKRYSLKNCIDYLRCSNDWRTFKDSSKSKSLIILGSNHMSNVFEAIDLYLNHFYKMGCKSIIFSGGEFKEMDLAIKDAELHARANQNIYNLLYDEIDREVYDDNLERLDKMNMSEITKYLFYINVDLSNIFRNFQLLRNLKIFTEDKSTDIFEQIKNIKILTKNKKLKLREGQVLLSANYFKAKLAKELFFKEFGFYPVMFSGTYIDYIDTRKKAEMVISEIADIFICSEKNLISKISKEDFMTSLGVSS